jgi:YHS domain-containing protein
MTTKLRALKYAIVAIVFSVAPMAAQSADPPSGPKLAIQGYDPVAYFTDSRAIRGKPEFSYVWDDFTYQFASSANRDRFASDPERYAPVFPGYCAAALSLGRIMRPDPEQWLIIDGKLYLFAAAKGRQMAIERPTLVNESRVNLERLKKEGSTQSGKDPM